MDAFEHLVSEILWQEGYWVRSSVKVELTKEEKVQINRPSSPRWELDIVAYRARDNILQVVECKSYLDSQGVKECGFDPSHKESKRYKLFNDETLQEVVFNRLKLQLLEAGACREEPTVRLALACGKIRNADRKNLHTHFESRGWNLWDEPWLIERLTRMAHRGYENQISAVVAKLLVRGHVE